MTKQRRITQIEFFRLCEWLKTVNMKGVHTFTRCADLATDAMGFPVQAATMQNAMEATKIALDPKPVTEPSKRDRNEFLAQELVRLQRSLGQEPSSELLSIANMPAAA